MGFGGISPWSLLIILVIVILLFGTKRLRNIGGDLGDAIKNFKKSVKDNEQPETTADDAAEKKIEGQAAQANTNTQANTNAQANAQGRVFDAEAERKDNK